MTYKCPVCRTVIDAPDPAEVAHCPACKEYILDRFPPDSKEGMNTARTMGGEALEPWIYDIKVPDSD